MDPYLGLTTICLGVTCGRVIYKYFMQNADDDDVSDVQTSDNSVIVRVANRLKEVYEGKTYVGLRIPDPDTGLQQNIDIVLVTQREVVVMSVKNLSENVSINKDGSWICTGEGQQGAIVHPDPVAEVKKQASILESYLERRGIAPQEGRLSYKVILPNPNLRLFSSNLPEVITYDQLVQLKPEHHKLNYILGTAPSWDRLELEGNRFIWGEFLGFKGKQEDILDLRDIKRSKVSRLITKKKTSFVVRILSYPRDLRNEGASDSERKKVMVKSDVKVLFRPENSTKVHKFKLPSILSLSLSP
ncbi:NERD domain-containing protein [Melia azedarach]|uniref:NERD domain-containing protein n=1 Tax=Melia azedarach TaxID=155640 RepID=A0ACC1YDT9_MELAZ|nr:NERD domain-containing protein [Melia azedarach]